MLRQLARAEGAQHSEQSLSAASSCAPQFGFEFWIHGFRSGPNRIEGYLQPIRELLMTSVRPEKDMGRDASVPYHFGDDSAGIRRHLLLQVQAIGRAPDQRLRQV